MAIPNQSVFNFIPLNVTKSNNTNELAKNIAKNNKILFFFNFFTPF